MPEADKSFQVGWIQMLIPVLYKRTFGGCDEILQIALFFCSVSHLHGKAHLLQGIPACESEQPEFFQEACTIK